METIRYLITFFIKIAIAFIGLAIVWWLVALLIPDFSYHSLVTTLKGDRKDILPPPRNYSGLFSKQAVQNEYTNVYVPAPAYNGYNLSGEQYTYTTYDYIQYTATGTVVTKNGATQPGRSTYVRNLSIYDGQYIRQGFSFVGDARSEFFQNGKFAILVLNNQGQVIGVLPAVATSQWSVPGWVRFQGLINFPLPNGACTLVFEQSLPNGINHQPVRIPYGMNCLQ